MHTKVPPSKYLISEQYHYGDFMFPKAPSDIEDMPQRNMAHEIVKEETLFLQIPN
jgi:hypothetical protein